MLATSFSSQASMLLCPTASQLEGVNFLEPSCNLMSNSHSVMSLVNFSLDQGSPKSLTTLLFSVPVSCLQIWGQGEKWYYAPYKPGALVVNIAPVDQSNYERLLWVLSNSSVGDFRMRPAAESPFIQREGCVEDQGLYAEFKKRTQQDKFVPTNRELREIQIVTFTDPTHTVNNRVGAHQVLIDGKLIHQREYMGVEVVLPV
ncbi:hypothetical protein FGADI_4323 [Fusarium gaditjirri]|uniref:Uncharacterized protein n=1 Tax=Fusarium gaditjirri TaxID=282569 RepID=A0A8H4TDQ0_9HYPO|nr:hypothetical protein FGADI_4323 [Fusarium gaditjirri]